MSPAALDQQQALDRAVGAFVEALVQAGVRHACACPGSRSTPLAIKLAQARGIKLWMHLDERSAAFFGLGLARATRQPVALLATSGTAAANFFPAVIEASLDRVPLVVLTADRPHELREVGAAQTIDQLHLYGPHARWFFDLPEPDASTDHVRLVRTLAARAVSTATAEPPGPVHLNWPFREPLVPVAGQDGLAVAETSKATPRVLTGRLAPTAEAVQSVTRAIATTSRGLLVCGPQSDPELPHALAALARQTGYPILADALSGVRCGPHDGAMVVDAYDAFLRDGPTAQRLAPGLILRFGSIPTSKPLQTYLQRWADVRQIVVDPGGWRDATATASDLLHADPTRLCAALCGVIGSHDAGAGPVGSAWAAEWLRVNSATVVAIDAHFAAETELAEGKVIAELQRRLPPDAIVYAGNSMPVRDLDTFFRAGAESVRCLANRGANGIDGVVSSALGASAASRGPLVLVIGDVSFYHDLNGLLAARQHGLDLLVVLINNDGGGIFSFLPQAETAAVGAHFEALFGTPQGLDFAPFVAGYGGRFVRVHDWAGFGQAVEAGLGARGLRVIEVPTNRARNVSQHRAVWAAVARAVAQSPMHVALQR